MCGRFSLSTDPKLLARRFNAELPLEGLIPNYNAAPSQILPVIPNQDDRKIQLFRWGLIPFWAKEISIGNKMINARAETVSEKPSFRDALKKRRCLVLADGFYEWQKNTTGKIPTRVILKSGEPFAFAGLWDQWRNPENPDDPPIASFTIITISANELLSPIHPRMPVILMPEQENIWLNNQLQPKDWLNLLHPYPSDQLTYYRVSNRVNPAGFNDPSVIEPVEDK